MKIFASILVVLCVSALFFTTATAHSGRTDADGGHYNRSTGEYHFHHGYPAHQHEDGVCPYSFDDQTGKSSGTNSGASIATARPSVSLEPKPEVTVARMQPDNHSLIDDSGTHQDDHSDSFAIIMAVFGTIIAAPFIVGAIVLGCKKRNEAKFERLRTSPELLSMLPLGTEIGKDRLPREINAPPGEWGEKYTVYITKSGKKYHTSSCRYKGAPVHVLKIPSGVFACGICSPKIPDCSWWIVCKKKFRL